MKLPYNFMRLSKYAGNIPFMQETFSPVVDGKYFLGIFIFTRDS